MFGILIIVAFVVAIPVVILDSAGRSVSRKKARRIVSGKVQGTTKTINRLIDTLNLTFGNKQRKDLTEKDRCLIESLRKVRDKQ